MAKTLQHRRGTTTELASVTGAIGEIFMDTDKKTLVVMDGTTAGGTPLAVEGSGGSGSSYDQSLNTTDNVVFDSALVGNVAIITNQVTGIDSYGNNDTLVLSGTEVNIGPAVPLVTTVATTYNNFGGAWVENASMYGVAGNAVIINGSGGSPLPTDMENTVSSLVAGDTIFIQPNMFTGGTWTLTSGFTYNGSYSFWIATVAESATLNSMGGTQSVTFTQASTSTQEASYMFAADGTLGVNQDFTILADSVTIQSDTTSSVTTPVTISSMAPSVSWQYDSISGKSYFGFFGSNDSQYAQYFKAGMTVNCFIDLQPGKGEAFTLTLITDMAYNGSIGAGSYIAETVEVKANNGMSTYIYKSDISTTVSSGITNNYTFAADGAFTAPSVVATSALIGDIAIAGNNIAAVDSYGNPAELSVSASSVVFDSDVNLSVSSLVSSTETVSAGMNMFEISFGMPGTPAFSYRGGMVSSEWVDSSKFVTGSIVTLTSSMYGNAVIQLTSDMVYAGMGTGWTASFTSVSGVNSGGGFSVTSVSVTNQIGSTSDYSFNDQGVLAAPTVSTNSLLINGVAPALLTSNVDGSKSVVVDKLISTTYAGQNMNNDPSKVFWNDAYWYGTMNASYQGKLQISNPNQFTIDLLNSLIVGDTITLTRMGPGLNAIGNLTLTVQTAGFAYDMNVGRYVLDVVESNTESSEWQFGSSFGITVTTLGSQEHNFSGTALTTNAVIADDALIGDVSIIGNTIAGVDSYGLADTLVVDGDLQVTGELSSPSALTVTVGGGLVNYDVNTGSGDTASWVNTPEILFSSNIDTAVRAIVMALPIGSHIRFTHYMYGAFDLVTTSVAVNDMFGAPKVGVSQGPSSYGLSEFSFDIDNVTFEYASPSATYGFGNDGALQLPNNGTLAVPSNTSTVVSWAKISIGGQTYYTPLYQ